MAAIVLALCGAAPAIFAQAALPGSAAADAANATVTASFDPEIGELGRPAIFRVRISAPQMVLQPPAPLPPAGLDFAFAGRSVTTTFVNGNAMMTSTFNYSVVPQRTGRFTIPAFDVMLPGGRAHIPATVLTVNAADADALPRQSQPVRAEVEMPQRDFFVGESIGARLLVIETPDEIPQFISHVAKTTGSAVVKPSLRTSREQFKIGGTQHEGLVMPLRVTPILEGDLELGIQIMASVQKAGFPGQPGFSRSQTTIDAKPARVRVLALPRTGRLPGFTGAIGKFTVAQPKLSATEIEAGEPVTMAFAMAGEGNLEGVAAPEIEASGGWQIYKPTSEFQADPEDHNSARGAKVFTYTLIPSRAGLKATPAMPFSYFDPERRAYVDVTIPPVPVTVKASSAAPAPAAPEAVKSEAPRPDEAPRVVEPVMTGLAEKSGRWVHSLAPPLRERWLIAAELTPPVLLLALWAWRRRRDWLAANPQIIRRRRAHSAARRALARARTAARANDRAEFLRASAGALREAASPFDTARADSLTREDVLRLLNDDPGASAIARKVLDSADAANYSTADAAAMEPRALLPELERAVHTLARRA
ncbi:MAG: BatD family protein [Chthoniobacteraceae bacterium]